MLGQLEGQGVPTDRSRLVPGQLNAGAVLDVPGQGAPTGRVIAVPGHVNVSVEPLGHGAPNGTDTLVPGQGINCDDPSGHGCPGATSCWFGQTVGHWPAGSAIPMPGQVYDPW